MPFCAPTQGVFAGMTQAQLQAALIAAQTALIQAQTGGLGVSFSYAQGDGNKSVTKKVTSVGEITALILQLQQALGMGRARRPIRYSF
jgi:hypothetical protein